MKLDTFEKLLSSSIQKKAYEFFTKKKVDELEQTDDKWVAFVREKDNDYDVTVTLKSKTIIAHSCDCDTDEPLCEHVAALLYAVQAHSEGTKSTHKTTKTVAEKITKPKKPAKPETFTELLEKVPADELRAFLKENFARNKDFKSLFMTQFMVSASSVESGLEKYMALLENAFKSVSDRRGYIDWNGCQKVIKSLKLLVKEGKTMFANRQYADVAYLSEALLVTASQKLTNVADTSELSAYASEGLSFLKTILEDVNIPQNLRDTVWERLVELSDYPVFLTSRSLEMPILEVLSDNAKDAQRQTIFIKLVDKKLHDRSKNNMDTFFLQSLLLLKVQFYIKHDRWADAQVVLDNNLHFKALRNLNVNFLIAHQNFAEAKKVLHQGISLMDNARDNAGLLESWDVLLKIAQKENDIPEIQRLAKLLWERSDRSISYYRIYKSSFPSKVWEGMVDTILEEYKESKHSPSSILIEEARWQALLEFVQQETNRLLFANAIQETIYYNPIQQYETYLLPRFPTEFIHIYREYIQKMAIRANDRMGYFRIGEYIKRLASYPDQKEATKQLLEKLISKYSVRPALADELKKLLTSHF
jgi:hypothetical protein